MIDAWTDRTAELRHAVDAEVTAARRIVCRNDS
jgi:hypothetical protein